MQLANVSPDLGALPQQGLAVGTLKVRCSAALVSVVAGHVAAVLVGAITSGTGVTLSRRVFPDSTWKEEMILVSERFFGIRRAVARDVWGSKRLFELF